MPTVRWLRAIGVFWACSLVGGVGCAVCTDTLLARGLTKREVDCLQHRHQRRAKKALTMDELQPILASLDALQLQPGQVAHLLRSKPLLELRADIDASPEGRWCSFKKVLCNCCASTPSTATTLRPVLGLDCEFKPLRCAVVDAGGLVVMDCIVMPPSGTAYADAFPLPGVLSCDRSSITRLPLHEVQSKLRELVTSGATFVAHTPQRDLMALELPDLPVEDVARLGLDEPGAQTASLQRMAAKHLGRRIHGGSGRHCAVEDALTALALYERLSGTSSA